MKINRFRIPTLFIVIVSLFTACQEEEPAPETTMEQLKDALIASEWSIDLFFDGDNKTASLAEFLFLFSDDGMVTAKQSSAVQGSWSVHNHGRGGSKLVLEFDPSTEVGVLTDEWRTVEVSESFLRFEDVGGGPGEITQVNKLTLKKNQ